MTNNSISSIQDNVRGQPFSLTHNAHATHSWGVTWRKGKTVAEDWFRIRPVLQRYWAEGFDQAFIGRWLIQDNGKVQFQLDDGVDDGLYYPDFLHNQDPEERRALLAPKGRIFPDDLIASTRIARGSGSRLLEIPPYQWATVDGKQTRKLLPGRGRYRQEVKNRRRTKMSMWREVPLSAR